MVVFNKKNILMEESLIRLNKSKKGRIMVNPVLLSSYLCGSIESFFDMYILNYYNNALELAENSLQNNENKDDIEGSLSKLHISDLIENPDKRLNSLEYLRLGLFVAELIYYRLKSEFSVDSFAIIVSFTIKGKYKDCIVSFHKIRDMHYYNEQSYFDNFQNEAVGLILTKVS
ncbi:MAG: hypothetical protein KF896_14105 [Ignavibacteriae bacterium]|nr:hypothetical protein [Ignavibacteriota bacterium]